MTKRERLHRDLDIGLEGACAELRRSLVMVVTTSAQIVRRDRAKKPKAAKKKGGVR